MKLAGREYFHVTRHPVAGNYYPLSDLAGTLRISDSGIPVHVDDCFSEQICATSGTFNRYCAWRHSTACW